ncbi:MAG: flagellar hook-basal body complex protein FliE [Rhizobiaceae bacterium]|nr:flagellar hook-basal body complex protein FliE [Rhizobiaceae bacterium]
MITGIGALDFSKIGGAAGLGKDGANPSPGAADATASFASVMADLATRTVDTLQTAEQAAVQGMQGQADTREVVDAVMSAEQALTAAVAIRDKIVSAYMEVSRMQI